MASFIPPDADPVTLADGVVDGAFLAKSGSTLVASAKSFEQIVTLGTTRTTTSTSFGDCTGLSFEAVAPITDIPVTYLFRAEIVFQSAAAGTGIALAVNGPTTPNIINLFRWYALSLTANTVQHSRAYNHGTASGSVDTADTDMLAYMEGILVLPSSFTGTTFIVRFASETAGTEVRIMSGSRLFYQRAE